MEWRLRMGGFFSGLCCILYGTTEMRRYFLTLSPWNAIHRLDATVKDFLAVDRFEKSSLSLSGSGSIWSPPPFGWLKANTDAAFKGGRAAIGVVIRDHKGCISLLSSKIIDYESALVSELLAIDWATDLAMEQG